ncbi:MAG: alginate lyase family protein [Rhodospirillales bacterium]|nr:alginate lyase family protein [Rhodospirillales bacterium]
MTKRLIELLRRGWRKPPHVIARWLVRQVCAEWHQHRAHTRARTLTPDGLLEKLNAGSVDSLWARLADAPFPTFTGPIKAEDYEGACPGDAAHIIKAAEDAVDRRVDLLGSGPVELGRPIQWHKDFKSGYGWPIVASRRLNVLDLHRTSDVKVPWELSRLQWLIPAGQAYLMTGDERYAKATAEIIDEWTPANPLSQGVNWACTMDVALRGISLVWLFRVFHQTAAWSDDRFRRDFLKLLYLHGDFTARHLEWSDINGNHLLADACGLVVMGLFFGDAKAPQSWQEEGWRILEDELPKQVFPDGVDFEVSAAYQRLVLELFLLPALYRCAVGRAVSHKYADRLIKMAEFIAAYSREDGSSPLWGDADDGRVLPFALHPETMTDHRYLIALVGLAFDDVDLIAKATDFGPEVFWVLGPEVANMPTAAEIPESQAFPDGGVYIMRNGPDHVFIDCGPVGMAGRGGHGHNDCLSFEAVLAGQHLLTDCGTYVYSVDADWRNDFRSTAFHNTPIIDHQEQNRFVDPNFLWTLMDDAKPDVRHWQTSPQADIFIGAHSGFQRLDNPVTPVRGIMLDKKTHRLAIADRFEGDGDHSVRIPYHLALGIDIEETGPGIWRLKSAGPDFLLVQGGDEGWTAMTGEGWISHSYGVKKKATVLNFVCDGPLKALSVGILPADGAPDDPKGWLSKAVEAFPA